MKHTNKFHFNQFEDSQKSDNDHPTRGLFREKKMEGNTSFLPLKEREYLLNLLLNAIQSMPQGGRLRLAVQTKEISKEGLEEVGGQYLEIRVEDTGVGMGKEVRQSLFQPFFTTKETGTGLGLMVTQGIVQDHGGWIEVESETGKGSVFSVYLPSFKGEAKNG